ncbi:hypothetical protein [Streptomyces sp. NPDC058872]|uniref:hypothetical protein n=1 Tax=Streptomyces sp. NPDC058872 TaxID=3346661 RepID=UPI0036B68991
MQFLDLDAEVVGHGPGGAAQAFLNAHAHAHAHGYVIRIRIRTEGTASYGAGFTHAACPHGHTVVEVNRPDRAERRCRIGTSDPIDANAALSRIALVRMSSDSRTREYVARQTSAGRTNRCSPSGGKAPHPAEGA